MFHRLITEKLLCFDRAVRCVYYNSQVITNRKDLGMSDVKTIKFAVHGTTSRFMSKEFEDAVKDLTPADVGAKLELHINSTGGSLGSAWAIYNRASLLFLPQDITTFAEGCCDSSALLLLMLGNTRVGFSSSHFLFHEASHSFEGESEVPLSRLEDMVRESRIKETQYEEVLASRACSDSGLGMSRFFRPRLKVFRSWIRAQGSTTIGATTALSHNIITQLCCLDGHVETQEGNEYEFYDFGA